jgi:hypothetical protein
MAAAVGTISTGNLRLKHVEQLAKTEMCKFFLQGNCGKGSRCAYAHALAEIREKPDLARTSMCREFLQSGNCNNPGCRFAHSETQLRTTETFFKTKICRFSARGRCKHGQACRFAHTSEELAILETDTQVVPGFQTISDLGGTDLGGGGMTAPAQRYPDWAATTETGGSSEGSYGNTNTDFDGGRNNMPDSGQAEYSDQSTKADTLAPVSTPEGSGDSGQEENMRLHFQQMKRRSANDDGRRTDRTSRNCGQANGENTAGRHCTTMMLTNVPNFLTQGSLVSLLEDLTQCMRGTFDFFYCPWDPYQDRNLGYAIVNFFSRTVAADFERQWSNKHLLAGCRGSKRLRIVPAALQGRATNIRHFSGFSLAHHADPRFRPLIRVAPCEPLKPMAIATELDLPQEDQTPQATPAGHWSGSGPAPGVPNVAGGMNGQQMSPMMPTMMLPHGPPSMPTGPTAMPARSEGWERGVGGGPPPHMATGSQLMSHDNLHPGWALLLPQVGQGSSVPGRLDDIIADGSNMAGLRLPERQPRSSMNAAAPANFFMNGLSQGSPYVPSQLAAMMPNVQNDVYYSD